MPSLDTLSQPSPIAVVGVSALFPGSVGSQRFWHNILEGKDFIEEIPADHWLIEDYYDPDPAQPGKIYAKRGAFLPPVPFDPLKYSLLPKALSATDTVQLLALIVAEKILDDAVSVQFDKVDRKDISVILGIASATELVGQMAAKIQKPHWVKALRESGLPESQVEEICQRIADTYPAWTESTFPGLLGNVVAGRIAKRLNLGGTNCVIDAACASSLGALAMAVQELQLGHSDLVISGGADTLNDNFMYMCFSKTPALSKTGDCRPFSDQADGTILGEGLGMVALRRLADAERDGDKIYAVIRGIGSSSDGPARSIYAPDAQGQTLAVHRAYERAGYGPEDVDLVEAHGTATPAGDAAEFEGLCKVYGPALGERKQQVALGSIKSQIGHTKAAAGIASLFKVIMALHHGVLPPTIKVERPNPKLDIENSPFYLNTVRRPWVHSTPSLRKASVSSFGFGGSNFHVTLEAYAGPQRAGTRFYTAPRDLLLVSADTVDGLVDALEHLLAETERQALNTVARQAQAAFDPARPRRLALLVKDAADAERLKALILKHLQAQPDQAFSVPNQIYYRTGGAETRVAVLFAGQGSQYLGMGADLAMAFPDALAAWDLTADLAFDDDRPLHRVVFPIPAFTDEERAAQAERLTQTQWAQPGIGAVSLSQLNLLKRLDLEPLYTAGHSYGELVALHAAGVIEKPEDLLLMSRKRGELMRDVATIPGGMTAALTSAEALAEKLRAWGADVTLANINSPNQVVLSGTLEALEEVEAHLEQAQIGFRRLPVATAFHSPLVAASVKPFRAHLKGIRFNAPKIPVYANTTSEVYPRKAEQIRKLLAEQLAHPVRFKDLVQRMYADGARVFLEIGPGGTLTRLVGECLADQPHLALSLDQKGQHGLVAFWSALGQLAVAGLTLNFARLWQDFAPCDPPDDPAQYSPATVQLNGSNYGKPYPPEEGAAGRPRPNPEPPSEAEIDPSFPMETYRDPSAIPPVSPNSNDHPSTQALVPAAPSQASPPSVYRDAAWHQAFMMVQQNVLEAQRMYQQTLTESHLAFLRASEAAFQQRGGVASIPRTYESPAWSPAPVPAWVAPPAFVPPPAVPAPAVPAPAVPAPAVPAPAPPPYATPSPQPLAGNGRASLSPPPSSVAVPSPAAPPAPVAAPTVPEPLAASFEQNLLRIVAERTGYPEEVLELDMALESDLGIDSIKRVEILGILMEEYPSLKIQDTTQLAALRTLREIVELEASLGE